jgi:4-aminobutyrate aminotransferase-like enzyme
MLKTPKPTLPQLQTEIPGPRSREHIDTLAATECPAITARRARRRDASGVDQDPIVWERAWGANVEDVDGNIYVDLTAAFAVCGLGHAHPAVVAAGQTQLAALPHAMGDVYPSRAKIELCELLADVAPGDLRQSILGCSGADAVEAALKTARVHTGKDGVVAFTGGYHGLSYGALAATAYRREFRAPFRAQINPHVRHMPFPNPYRPPVGAPAGEAVGTWVLELLEARLSDPVSGWPPMGAMIVEPIQARGGDVVPPSGFLAGLREVCDRHGIVLIFDEIYCGFGRTGRLFACEHEGVLPDLLCAGKAMGGGFPISACIGRPDVMASWGASKGEAIHTQTFLGNPIGSAMAAASSWPSGTR